MRRGILVPIGGGFSPDSVRTSDSSGWPSSKRTSSSLRWSRFASLRRILAGRKS